MTPETDQLAAELAAIRQRNEKWIASMALTEASVDDAPFGDVRRLVAAVEAVLKVAHPGPVYVSDATIRAVITRELLSE